VRPLSNSLTIKDTKNASSVACGREVRDHSVDFIVIAFTVGGFTLLTFIVRLLTRLTTQKRELYSDDWIMLAAVVSNYQTSRSSC
jgi:hypothetical protein